MRPRSGVPIRGDRTSLRRTEGADRSQMLGRRRLRECLGDRGTGKDDPHLTAEDRRAMMENLREMKPPDGDVPPTAGPPEGPSQSSQPEVTMSVPRTKLSEVIDVRTA